VAYNSILQLVLENFAAKWPSINDVKHTIWENFRLRVNFISVLRAAFTSADPESAKNLTNEAVFLVMLGATSFPARPEVYGKTTEKFVPS